MANQVLNTRINLKIDTLSEWLNSELILGKGEVAIATASSSVGTGLEEPVCMIKIGDGEKTFSELTWNFYAKAADVVTACKTEQGLIDFIKNVIKNSGITSDEAMQGLANDVASLQSDITILKEDADTVGSIANSIKNAIEALNLNTTYVTVEDASTEQEARINAEAKVLQDAKDYADDIKTELLGEGTISETYDTLKEIAGWIETHEGQTVTNLTQLISDEAQTRENADIELSNRIQVFEDNKDNYALKSSIDEVKNYADSLSSNYATAEQGGKATTALQTIASTSDGLKITDKGEATSQSISFNEECIFIFECGDSKTNVV